MTRKRRRMLVLALAMGLLGSATALVLVAFQDSLVFFYSPSDVLAKGPPGDRSFRLGGLVEPASVARSEDGRTIHFRVTDGANAIPVAYRGVLPDLFREGQGVVTEGRMLADGRFEAREVLAKHDETYMPREVADALKKSGHWKEGEPPPAGGRPAARP
ncbi:cytochrome c maturation protein CcmE [Stella sp.]|uniref:cytochrome c maturation protein CcmE n=1 Tax=Stella sp. TaxID=2912054 RepID=UPI0035B2BC20